jgi:hypothetical protein
MYDGACWVRIAAAILTFDIYRTGREALFHTTLQSLSAGPPDALTVVTAGSTDGTETLVRDLGGIVDPSRSDIWFGETVAIEWCLQQAPDIVLFSNDDILYAPDWRPRLSAFWQAAPADVLLVSLIMEPSWPWNTVYDARTIGSERVLLRENAPSAAWSFRARDWRRIGPIPQQKLGSDVTVSRRLRRRSFHLGQLELAQHLGEARSTYGNASWQSAQPLDRVRWGLPADLPSWCVTPEAPSRA